MKNQNPFAAYEQGKRHAQLVEQTYEALRNQRINEHRVAKGMRPVELSASVANGGHATISTMTPAEASAALAKLTEKIITDSGGKPRGRTGRLRRTWRQSSGRISRRPHGRDRRPSRLPSRRLWPLRARHAAIRRK